MTIKIEKLRAFIDSVKEFIEFVELPKTEGTVIHDHDFRGIVKLHTKIIKQALAELEGESNE